RVPPRWCRVRVEGVATGCDSTSSRTDCSSALSITTRWSTGRVWPHTTSSDARSGSSRRCVTTTATTRRASRPSPAPGFTLRVCSLRSGLCCVFGPDSQRKSPSPPAPLPSALTLHPLHVLGDRPPGLGPLVRGDDLLDPAALADAAVVDPHRRVAQ